jgi:hypothetical protein
VHPPQQQQQKGSQLLVPNSAAAREAAAALRKHLLSAGFADAWADGVAAEVRKGTVFTTPERAQAAIDYLGSLGVPLSGVENMASLCKEVLAAPVEAHQAVVAYLAAQGVEGAALVRLLEAHPKVLTYAVADGGKWLERGAARAAVVFADRGGKKVAGVQHWREGAKFGASPVAPSKPV